MVRQARFHERFPRYVYARRVGETSQARKVKPPISIYDGPHDRARRRHVRTRRTSRRVKKPLRLSRRDLRRSFKTYDERVVVGLGAREGGRLSCPFPSSCPGKIERGRKARRRSLDRALPGGLPTGAKTFN